MGGQGDRAANHGGECYGDLVAVLRDRARRHGERTVYVFLDDGETESARLCYSGLERAARAIGARLEALKMAGERVLLVYPPGLAYIEAFFGCLYAGAVAVPVHPPSRYHLARLLAVVRDARPALALTMRAFRDRLGALTDEPWRGVQWLTTDDLPAPATEWMPPPVSPEATAFLQYTSGSTGDPKGVMVSHANLIANQRHIHAAFGHDEGTTVVGWLPLFHDMGLVGNVLQPIYAGTMAVLMPPLAFLERPLRWLSAITHYRAHTSGGPNFAYELCARRVSEADKAGLDLRSWAVAFNGAEPVRAATLDRFAAAFAGCGFRSRAFFPCYGLAEATLFVSGPRRGQGAHRIERPDAAPAIPCGRGWGGEGTVAIVDPETRQGCIEGEVWVRGPSVAQGYWDRPELSRATFYARRADAPEHSWLRTGDLGFFAATGLCITGRIKDLIIIRGRNYHPQDLEEALEERVPELRPGGTAAFSIDSLAIDGSAIDHRVFEGQAVEAPGGEERLVMVAELARRHGGEQSPEATLAAMRAALAERCDAPAASLVLTLPGAVPKTSSGKLRRHACRAAYLAGTLPVLAAAEVGVDALGSAAAPEDMPAYAPEAPAPAIAQEIERHLIERAAALLGVPAPALDPDRPLRVTGIDSLQAVEIRHALERDLGIVIPVTLLLGDESIRALSREVAGARVTIPLAPPAAAPQAAGLRPLSGPQSLLWTAQRLDPAGIAYNLHLALRLFGALDAARLQDALAALAARHGQLRATYRESDNGVVEGESPQVRVDFEQVDARSWRDAGLQQDLTERARRPFDLAHGPLLRVTLYHHEAESHTFLLGTHHIALDLWSMLLLLEELPIVYQAGEGTGLAPPGAEYADFCAWQRAYLAAPAAEADWDYWRVRLAGPLPVLALPCDHPRPVTAQHRGGSHALRLGPGLRDRLLALARAQGVTPFVLLLAAYQVLLYKYTGQQEIIVGTAANGRPAARFARTVGNFVNPIAIRTVIAPAEPFSALLGEVRSAVLGALEHGDYPFARLVERLSPERSADHTPVYQSWFVLQRPQGGIVPALAVLALGEDGPGVPFGDWRVAGVCIEDGIEPMDLKLMAADTGDGLLISFQYRRDLFEPATIARLAEGYEVLLTAIARRPGVRIAELSVLPPGEHARLVHHATEVDFPGCGSLLQRFAGQVARRPEAPAVVFGGENWSYRALDGAVRRIAHGLAARAIEPEAIVAICAQRTVELPAAILGCLRAGTAYLPLDPGHPRQRIAGILADARPRLILVQPGLSDCLPETDIPQLLLDPELSAFPDAPGPDAAWIPHPEQLAYVIYTSGSTGRPKGVGNVHRGLENRLLWMQSAYGLGGDDAVLQKTPYTFDVSVWEFLWPLSTGARLVLAGPGEHHDPERLMALIEAHGVTTVHFVPSMLAAFLEVMSPGRCRSLRRVIASGEALPAALAARFHERLDAELHNLYGPTEASIDVTAWPCTPGDGHAVPIGRPIANTVIYLLDGALNPVPVGVTGELYIGGVGLSRGYLRQPGQTAASFLPDPYGAPGGRIYRSRDVARYRTDGAIDYLGRIDHQVKVRGFRIEPGEIEALLMTHPAVREAVVIAREDLPGGKGLVAYIVPCAEAAGRSDTEALPHPLAAPSPVGVDGRAPQPDADALRRHLALSLPSYMLPVAFVTLDRLPLGAHGKLDRTRLPCPDLGARSYTAPSGEAEKRLARIWAEVLGLARAGVDHVGVEDDFFALGGDSILAIQIAIRAHREGFRLSPRDVFRYPSVAALAAAVPAHSETIASAAAPYALATLPPEILDELRGRPGVVDAYPLSPMQEGMLFHTLMQPGSGVYVMQDHYVLRGAMDVEAFQRAWQAVVDHHPVLRSAFLSGAEHAPHQVVHEDVALPFEYLDWRGLAAEEQEARLATLCAEERARGFDLAVAPLLCIRLVRLAEERYRCIRSYHHLLMDEWCTSPLWLDFRASYLALRAGRIPPAPAGRPYRDYLDWLSRRDGDAETIFWRTYLAGFRAATPLVLDGAPGIATALAPLTGSGGKGEALSAADAGSGHGRVEDVEVLLSSAADAALAALARREGLTANTVVQGAFALLLSHYSGRPEILFGVTVAGRPSALPGIEDTIGLFINSLPLRVRVRPGDTVRAWLKALLAQNLALREHESTPLLTIQSCSELAPGEALFRHLLVYENAPVDPSLREPGAGIEMDYLGNRVHTNYPITVTVIPGSRMTFKITYATACFERAAIERLLRHFVTLTEHLVERPHALIGELPLQTGTERRWVLEAWNGTDQAPQSADFIPTFERQVRRTPSAIAVRCGEDVLSYAELHGRASRLAGGLCEAGAGPEAIVAVLCERGIDLLVAMLAILKAGAAYLPLDPSHPPGRHRAVLAASRPALLLCGAGLTARAAEIAAGVEVAPITGLTGSAEASRMPRVYLPQQLAYVIYTSGSTGAPKGAMVTRAGLNNNLMTKLPALALGPADVIAQTAPPAFDISLWQHLSALLCGARVEIVPDGKARDPVALAGALGERGISVLESVPALIQALTEIPMIEGMDAPIPGTLRWLLPTGESLAPETARRFMARYPAVRLLNCYGPAECADDVAYHEIAVADGALARIPIGRPVPGLRIHLLNRYREPLPPGVTGELCIAGVGVGRGYLGRPGLTAESFLPDPFGPPGTRLYRSGDLARRREDGILEFLGRTDHQLKLRGHRIEPGEIEHRLLQHPAVREAAVTARVAETGDSAAQAGADARLVAYVVGVEGLNTSGGIDAEALRAHLRERLPEYMVPALFVILEALPRNSNGKLDRPALPEPDWAAWDQDDAARTPAEELIAGIWAIVLCLPTPGVHQDFFALGGHSLHATQVIGRINAAFGIELPLAVLFDAPTVAGLAAAVAAAAGGAEAMPAILPVPRTTRLPLSSAQRRIWLMQGLAVRPAFYHFPIAIRLSGALHAEALEQAVNDIVARHESLRTVVRESEEGPYQAVLAGVHVGLRREDLGETEALQLPGEWGRVGGEWRRDGRSEAERSPSLGERIAAEIERPFDLAEGPLLRLCLYALGPDRHVLLMTLHHIACDGWSGGVLARELAALYRGHREGRLPRLPPLCVQYPDFAVAEEAWLAGPGPGRQLDWWRETLRGAPPRLALGTAPKGGDTPGAEDTAGAEQVFTIERALVDALDALLRRHGMTRFMGLLAVLDIVLHHHTGATDIVVGADSANRRPETEPLIGFFINLLALRTDVGGDPGFVEVLRRVRGTTLGAYAHREVPFDRVVGAVAPLRSLGHAPLFQVKLVAHNVPLAPLELAGLCIEPMAIELRVTELDLTLHIRESPDGLQGGFEYRTAVFDAAAVARLAAHFLAVLERAVAVPATTLAGFVRLLEQHDRASRARSIARQVLPPVRAARRAAWPLAPGV